jgi:membrane-associated phospholipid phosphatase
MKKIKLLIPSILIFVGCFSFSNKSQAQSGEINLLKDINTTNPSNAWVATTNSTYPIAIASPISILAAGYIKKDKALQRKGWQAAGAIAINTVITQGLKYSINRSRPYQDYPTLITPYDATEKGKSFPSGHTSSAFATAASLSINFKKWYVVVPAYTWATAVGYSRLKLGEHYPTDVLAGAIVGAGSAYLSHWLNKKLFAKNK